MAILRVKTGPNRGKVFEIKDQVLTLGRDESQTIQILDQGVSRAHAEIFRLGDACFVRDLDSTNGTFINSVKVSEETLRNGDELRIGTTIVIFEDGPSTEPREDGEGAEKGETTTISLKLDKGAKSVSREIGTRNLSGMVEIGKILGAGKELKPSLQRTIESLTAAIQADQGYLYMLEAGTGKLIPTAFVEHREPGGEKKVSRTIVNRVLKSGAPTVTIDATLDERFSLSESIVLKKVKSVIAVPIVIRDQTQGLLYFHTGGGREPFGADDLELVAAGALQIAIAIAGHKSAERLRRGVISTVRALAAAIEAADPKCCGHAERVADCATVIAVRMGLPREEVHNVRLAALLCDIGCVAAPAGAPAKEHVFAAEKILAGIEGAEGILPGVRYHHERADGTGYPYKVRNDQTPLMARIIIVANQFDLLCAAGGKAQEALQEMGKRGGTEFDEEVVKALIACHRDGTLGAGANLPEE